MLRLSRASLLALSAAALVAAGCGDDDENDTAADAPAAPAQTTPAPAEAQETPDALNEDAIRELVADINEDPALLCDEENITGVLLEQIGGVEACREVVEAQDAGGDYEIEDVTIEGNAATAIIVEDDQATAVTFTVEDGRVKVAAQGPAQAEEPPAEE